MNTALYIRPAVVDDATTILGFIRELAIYEKAEHEVIATVDSIADSMFGPDSATRGLIAETGDKAIGFAVYFFSYSTWLGKHGIYLEDLFVAPDYRGLGAGKALLQQLARLALENDCGRVEWSVLDWNEPAIQFYKSIGAQAKDEWIGYRLSGSALVDFARQQ